MTIKEIRMMQYMDLSDAYLFAESRWFRHVRDTLEEAHNKKLYYRDKWWRLSESEWKMRENYRMTINVLYKQMRADRLRNEGVSL